MDKITDSGVSPVLGTFLLLALSVVMIVLVMISVNGIMGAYTPVYDRSVGFTIEVDATNSTALITPVSGTDLPFLESYRVYTTNGQWDSPSPGGITVTDFNSTVHFVNIVGNFTDQVTALVFSGKVTIEGGQVVIEPVGGGYYEVGTEGYDNTTEFIDSFNDWYHTYYPNATGDAVSTAGDGINFINDLPIIIGNQPITISDDNIHDLNPNNFRILISGNGNFTRAPGYELALFVIKNKKVKIELGTLKLDGMGLPATHPAFEIIGTGSELSIENDGHLLVKNNINLNGNGGGIYNEGTITINNGASLEVIGNIAYNGGGVYNVGRVERKNGGTVIITNNNAVNNGGGVYNAGTFISTPVTGNTAGGLGPNVYNA
ncbi:hypothetical protein [Methanocorpusculum sp. GPch4]|uniref:hypothetical protein n=1 Tax=Methanocorpusculum sp. GPch4 TaxID=2527877 RepID=UPI001432DE5B|nr:hypothetical protein [Methanocorpusculum sp. GPch4]